MKSLSLIVCSLAALAAAAPAALQSKREAPHAYCSPLSYGQCVPGVEKFGEYNYKQFCGYKVDLKKSSYVKESTHDSVTFDQCVLGCSNNSICCAVNYNACSATCEWLVRSDGTDHCYKSPVYYVKTVGYDGANNVPPSEAS